MQGHQFDRKEPALSKSRPEPGSGWARLDYPLAFRTRLEEFSALCGWIVRDFDGVRYVRTREGYERRSHAGLLSLHALVLPGQPRVERPEGFLALGRFPTQEGLLGPGLAEPIASQLRQHAEDPRLATAVAYLQLMFTTCPTIGLGDQVRTLEEQVVSQVDPESSLHVLRLAPELNWRAAAARTLLAADFAPDSLRQDTGTFRGFDSGRAVLNALTYGAVPFMAPALLTATPFVNGVMSGRAGGNLIWLFGRPLAGRVYPADGIIEATASTQSRFQPRQRLQPAYDRPGYEHQGSLEFLRWWVGRINVLLAMATDIGRFVDTDTRYQPRRHFTFLLSLERLFSDLHQTLTEAGRNETARLRLAYDALDCIDGMRAGSFADMTTPSNARKALDQLRSILPAAVATVVLPRCEAAVVALEQVREGFFGGMVSEHGLLGVPGITGNQVLGWDKATPQYLRIDRNSAHSFLKELEPDGKPHKFAVFAAHDAQLSPLLADLALLWVLRLLTEPWLLEGPLTAPHRSRRMSPPTRQPDRGRAPSA